MIFNESLKLTIGGRHFDYDRKEVLNSFGVFAGGSNIHNIDSDESGSKGKVNLAYTHDDNSLLYAQWAQGFRFRKACVSAAVSDM